MTHSQTSHPVLSESLLRRIRGEFLEMPGMCLTAPQAARLWNLDAGTSHAALKMLVETGFLLKTGNGHYVVSHWTTREGSVHHRYGR